ncbi:MAG TPA: peptidoglycan-associated lipoprotein Pal [Gemmatimonadaceae bacterium]|jgi:peptidoglycan-associated lipoprotein|nr:peptidoglycan-associated lipoprotein Pal [Gemmatimonadaceae bacterium]
MHRASRAVSLSVIALVALGACKKKPEVAPAPVEQPASAPQPAPPPPAPAQPTCDAACVEARNNAAKGEAIRAATAALTATIYFDLDRSDITDDSRAKLDAKVPVLSQNTAVRIRIAGHTDSRGSDEYNLALGQRRAAAAKRYLTDRGIDGSRIEIVSFGEERPTCTDESEGCWSRNRRDEFEITGGQITAVQTSSR